MEFWPNEKWQWWGWSGFHQDTSGWTENEDTPEETYHEPTYTWRGKLRGLRAKPIGEPSFNYFYQQAEVYGKEGEPINEVEAEQQFRLAVEWFDEFATCECVLGKPCARH